MVYDGLGRVAQISNPYQSGNPVWTTTAYDALGRVTSVTTPDGATVTTEYDGTRVKVKDQADKLRVSETDAFGHLSKVWEVKAQDGDTDSLTWPQVGTPSTTYHGYLTNYTYDLLDNLIQVTQVKQTPIPVTQTRTFSYDSLKRLLSANNPESGLTSYSYDKNNNLKTKTDARGITTTLLYDALNRVTTKDYSDSTPDVNYRYDSNQSLLSPMTGFDPGFATGRLVAVNYGTGSSEGDYFKYDQLGRVVLKTQRTGTVNYTTTASYNRASALLGETYPSGHSINYAYDTAGRLSSMTGNLGDGALCNGLPCNYATGLSYTAAGLLAKEQFGTATPLYHRLHYNNRQQLYDIRLGTDPNSEWSAGSQNRGALWLYYNSAYSFGDGSTKNNGNVYRADHIVPMDDNLTNYVDSVSYYGYDELNRLTSVVELPIANWISPYEGSLPQPYAQRYSYDRFGNRLLNQVGTWGIDINRKDFAVEVPIDPITQQPLTVTNRLVVPTGQSGTMSYDAAGNLFFDNYSGKPNESRNYYYDAEQRLTLAQVTLNGSTTNNSYGYDAAGRRVRRTLNGVQTWQVYGLSGELLAEYGANGAANSPQKEYGYRNGQLLIVAEGADRKWLVADQLGTPRMVLDATGSLAGIKRHDYLPFGEELPAGMGVRSASSGYIDDNVRQKFTGYERDGETGLDYAKARYYSSTQGRFTGVDPMNFGIAVINPQNWNRYIYSLNNPLSVTDKNGKWPTPIHDLIVDMAFPGLSGRDRYAMKMGSHSVDFYGQIAPITLLEQNANQHAMRRAGQSAEDAVKGANAFIAQNEAEALRVDQGQSIYNWTYYHFGRGAHTMMDGTSPAHAPFQEYGGLQSSYVFALDVALFGVWWGEIISHSRGEARITSEQLNNAVSGLRSRFEALYGTERYRQAVPSLFQNAFFVVMFNKVRQLNVPDLGTVTVRADGSQEYTGPLQPRKKKQWEPD